MNRKWDGIERRISLRTEAEAMVDGFYPAETSNLTTEKLLHELLVHKVELEIQNEELRKAHAAMEEMRDRYLDLYEFAPIAYISIDPEGMIGEINLTGSALLGIERANPAQRRFSSFVAPEDRDRWYRQFAKMMETADTGLRELDMELARADGSRFYAHLHCLPRETSESRRMLRVAVTDIGKIGLQVKA